LVDQLGASSERNINSRLFPSYEKFSRFSAAGNSRLRCPEITGFDLVNI